MRLCLWALRYNTVGSVFTAMLACVSAPLIILHHASVGAIKKWLLCSKCLAFCSDTLAKCARALGPLEVVYSVKSFITVVVLKVYSVIGVSLSPFSRLANTFL